MFLAHRFLARLISRIPAKSGRLLRRHGGLPRMFGQGSIERLVSFERKGPGENAGLTENRFGALQQKQHRCGPFPESPEAPCMI